MQNPYKGFSEVNPQPQGEPGWSGDRRIENTIWHVLMSARLTGPEWQLFLTIIDKTWGYHKTCDAIALSQFVTATGLDKSQVIRSLRHLEEMRILIVGRLGPGREKIATYMFNKYFDTWLLDKTRRKGVTESPIGVMVSENHHLESKGVTESPNNERAKGDSPTPLAPVKGVNLEEKGDTSGVEKGDSVTPTKEKRNISKEISTSYKEKEGANPPDSLGAVTPASKYLFEKTHRKRWANEVQKEEFERSEAQVGFPGMKDAIDWALTSGIDNIKSIITAAKRGRKEKDEGGPDGRAGKELERSQRREFGERTGAPADRRDPLEASKRAGWKFKRSGPAAPDGGEGNG